MRHLVDPPVSVRRSSLGRVISPPSHRGAARREVNRPRAWRSGWLAPALIAVALALGLPSPAGAGIVSREEVTPWLTRYVIEGTSSDFPTDPHMIRIDARDAVTVTVTLHPSPLSPHGPASVRLSGGCIFIPHPFTPYHPCTDPPAYPSAGATTTFGPPLMVTDPYVPRVLGYQGLGTSSRLAYTVSPGATAVIEVGVNAPLPPFFTTREKEQASENRTTSGLVGLALGACALFPHCKKVAGIVGFALGSYGLSQHMIARDPVDTNFTVIAQPILPVAQPPTGLQPDDAAHALASGLHRARAYADAAVTSAYRALGAYLAGSAFWYQEQLDAMNVYKAEMRAAQAALPGLLGAVSAAVAGEPVITTAQLEAARQTLITHGFSADELLEFAQEGISPADVDDIRLLIGTRSPAAIAGTTLAGLLVRPDIVAGLTGAVVRQVCFLFDVTPGRSAAVPKFGLTTCPVDPPLARPVLPVATLIATPAITPILVPAWEAAPTVDCQLDATGRSVCDVYPSR